MWGKIYETYAKRIYPKIKNIRGSHRLKRVLKRFSTKNLESVSQKEIKDIYDREWDLLIIIDSCRQDVYQEVAGKEGKRVSKASSTPGYIRENFSEGDFNDIVYITGNPQFGEKRFKDLTGRSQDQVFHSTFQTFRKDWDDKDNTMKAGPVLRDLKTAMKLFPDKKYVVHFLQPHQPFFKKDFDTFGLVDKFSKENPTSKPSNIWNEVEKGKVDEAEVIDGYRKNIEYIQEYVKKTKEITDGTIYLTSDHGNFIGEGGLYGHPENRDERAIREVPWVKLDN